MDVKKTGSYTAPMFVDEPESANPIHGWKEIPPEDIFVQRMKWYINLSPSNKRRVRKGLPVKRNYNFHNK